MKTCSKCNETKPDSNFYRGRQCRKCIAQAKAEWIEKNKEHVNAYNKKYRREYYIKNRFKILAHHREHQAERTEKKREWMEKNREHIREYMRLYMREYSRGFRRTNLCDRRLNEK